MKANMKRMLMSLVVIVILCPAAAVAQNSVEIFGRLDKTLGVKLPAEYGTRFQYFVTKNRLFSDKGVTQFTENFITEQMRTDWGISKQNQLIFVWDAIYEQITSKNIYTGEDGDDKRLKEFEKAMDRIEQCGKQYYTGFRAYMQQRSADAERRSADAVKSIIQNDSIWVGNNMIEFYNTYNKNPKIIKQSEIDFMKKGTSEVIIECKEYNIDYRAILLKEMGDKNKVDAILKFYGVE